MRQAQQEKELLERQAALEREQLRLQLAPGVEIVLLRVAAGEFRMGSTPAEVKKAIEQGADAGWLAGEQPQHTVYLDEYWIAKSPVTNVQYAAYVQAAKAAAPSHWKGSAPPSGFALVDKLDTSSRYVASPCPFDP